MSTYSTLSEARTAYLANADYADGNGDTAKGRAFRAACRSLLVLLPEQASRGSTSTRMSIETIRKELDRVEAWLGIHDTNQASAGRVVYGNVNAFRDQ